MDDFNYFVLTRAIHVLAVVLWIGGVAFITLVLLPALMKLQNAQQRIDMFEQLESRFAFIAKISTLTAGVSGYYMLEFLDAWQRYQNLNFWWLHLMTFVWCIFIIVLFVLEPLFLHRWFLEQAEKDSEKTFSAIQRMHYVLLTLSLIAVFSAVSGSHGYF